MCNRTKRAKKQKIYTAQKDRNFSQRASSSMLLQDIFAEPIQLNFRGQKAFSSQAGMLLSLLVRVSILLFAVTRGLGVLQRPSEFIQLVEAKVDFDEIKEDAGSITWDAMNFDFMIGFDRMLSLDVGKITM